MKGAPLSNWELVSSTPRADYSWLVTTLWRCKKCGNEKTSSVDKRLIGTIAAPPVCQHPRHKLKGTRVPSHTYPSSDSDFDPVPDLDPEDDDPEDEAEGCKPVIPPVPRPPPPLSPPPAPSPPSAPAVPSKPPKKRKPRPKRRTLADLPPRVARLVKTAANCCDVFADDLLTSGRFKSVVRARRIVVGVLRDREFTNCEIGRFLNLDNSTVATTRPIDTTADAEIAELLLNEWRERCEP